MQNNQASEEQPDRAAARTTLLAAARSLAERDGVEAVTIGKVAEESGMPRAAVMSQFARKEDLLMSIVSDDLAALARTMKGIDWPLGGETPESAVVVQLPRPAEQAPVEPPSEAPAEMVEVAKDVSQALSTTTPVASLTPRQRLTRRGELAQAMDAKSAGEESEAKDARAPDAWLERRLRVFERAMNGMEARQSDVEKSARAAAATAEDSIKSLQATIEELQQRADAADARHKTSANEVRVALNETALRLQTVEGVARAALAENHTAQTPEPQTVVAEPMPAPQIVPEAAPGPDEEATADAAPKSFIADVRKNVVAASAAAAANAEAKTEAKAVRGRKSITRYLLGGLGVMVVFIAAAGVAFSKGVDDGRRDALTHIVRIVPPPLGAAALTPLDRLTARAQAGDTAAELQVGLRYLNGMPKDPQAAMRWVTLSAIHGQPVAQYLLGTLYASSDAGKALQWFEAAALQGNRKAMHALAVAYAEGQGTAKSPSEAVRWFSRAAGFGYVDSQFNLAVLYERGDGVPQSLLDAFKWYAVAGRQGDAEAKLRLDALRTQLGADDLAAAQHAADTFRALPYDVASNVAP